MVKDIDNEIVAAEKELKTKKQTAEIDRQNELKSKGADTEKIKSVEKLILDIGKELEFIKNNRHFVSDYHKDKKDSFELQFRIVELTRGSIIVCSKLWQYMAQTQVENRNFLKRLLF